MARTPGRDAGEAGLAPLAASDSENGESSTSSLSSLLQRRSKLRTAGFVGAVGLLLAGTACIAVGSAARGRPAAGLSDVQLKTLSHATPGFYATSASKSKTFEWAQPKRSVKQAFEAAFKGWYPIRLHEGRSIELNKDNIIKWTEEDLLGGPSPFEGGKVPIPWPREALAIHRDDQVDPGHWVAYSRRQVCYIAAKSIIGATTKGYNNGLARYLEVKAGGGRCTAGTGDFGRGLFNLLAACAADPLLENGGQGPAILVAKAKDKPAVDVVRKASMNTSLATAGLRVCQYDDGAGPLPAGIDKVPDAGCRQPPAGGSGPGVDFMTGGLTGQALQDISAAWLGGYIYGNNCGLGGGQDERLMVYMPEVFVLSFFLSEAPGTNPEERHTPQVRQPAWVLGARRVMKGLDGTARWNDPPMLDEALPLTSDIKAVKLDGKMVQMSSSMPFIAFMSESQDNLDHMEPGCNLGCSVKKARRNRHVNQRAVDASVDYSFEKQVRAWYGSVALTSYAPEVQAVLKTVVKSLGTGPWLSGLWWGDSQLGLLAMWIGHAVAATTWGEGTPLNLDYYLYSAFTENPGNQCYVHSKEPCKACLKQCGVPPPSAYWLPGFSYTGASDDEGWGPARDKNAKACVTDQWSCGKYGLQDLIHAFKSDTARSLWDKTEKALRGQASNVKYNVFDVVIRQYKPHATK